MGAEDGLYVYDGEDDDLVTKHHPCARIIHGNGGDYGKRLLTEPAFVTDGSGYAARLRVLPTFGCTLHEDGGAT